MAREGLLTLTSSNHYLWTREGLFYVCLSSFMNLSQSSEAGWGQCGISLASRISKANIPLLSRSNRLLNGLTWNCSKASLLFAESYGNYDVKRHIIMDPRAAYLQSFDVDSLVSSLLELILTHQPDNPKQFLIDFLQEDVKITLDDAQALLRATAKISNEMDPMEATQVIIEICCELLNCERASIFIHEPSSRTLKLVVGKGAKGLELRDDAGVSGEVVQTGQVVNVLDAYNDPRFNKMVDERTGFKTRNLLGCPIKDASEVTVGVLMALNKNKSSFSLRDEAVIKHLACQAGVTIRNAQVFAQAARNERRNRALLHFIKSLNQDLPVQSLAIQVTSNASDLLQVRTCSIFIVDYQRLSLLPIGADTSRISKLNASSLGKVALTGEILQLSQNDPMELASLEHVLGYLPQSVLAGPIYDEVKENIIGVIQLSDKKQSAIYGELSIYLPFTEEDSDFLKYFSELIGKRLDKAFKNIIRLQTQHEVNAQSQAFESSFGKRSPPPKTPEAIQELEQEEEDEEA